MHDLKSCQNIIEEKISGLEFPESPGELYEPIKYILKLGGKRIRPVFTLMAHNLFSDDLAEAINPALAIEVFHNFTLLHDDIMDNADKRRGQKTVHKKWNENTAILSGDAMMILAYEYITRCSPEKKADVFRVFNHTAMEVCEGQQLDMNFENLEIVPINDYINMIRLKTSVLIAAALQIGAITAGANQQDQQLLYDFGLNLGIGFQLQDDFLDVFANPEKFGKKVGGDIVQNKKTFLLISALNYSDKNLVNELKKLILLSEKDMKKKVQGVKEIYNRMKIPEITKTRINEYFQLGMKKLELVGVDDKRKSNLISLAKSLMVRQY